MLHFSYKPAAHHWGIEKKQASNSCFKADAPKVKPSLQFGDNWHNRPDTTNTTPPRYDQDTVNAWYQHGTRWDTKTPPRHHLDTMKTPMRYHQKKRNADLSDATEWLPRHHRDTTETSKRQQRHTTKRQLIHHQDTTRHLRDITERAPKNPPKDNRDTTETPPTTKTPPDNT